MNIFWAKKKKNLQSIQQPYEGKILNSSVVVWLHFLTTDGVRVKDSCIWHLYY